MFISVRKKGTFAEKPQMKISNLEKQKRWYIIPTWWDKAFKGTVVNRALPVKITLSSVRLIGVQFLFSQWTCFYDNKENYVLIPHRATRATNPGKK